MLIEVVQVSIWEITAHIIKKEEQPLKSFSFLYANKQRKPIFLLSQ